MHTNIHGFIRELSGPRPLCRAVDSLKTAYDLESHHSGVPLGNQPTVRTVAGEWERLLSVRLNLYRGRHPLADTTFDAQTFCRTHVLGRPSENRGKSGDSL